MYNHSASLALKNTLDYFLEEYFFKPSAIVSYSVGSFGGVAAGNHLRQILAEMSTLGISSQFPKSMKFLMMKKSYLMKIMTEDSLDF